MTAKKQPLHQQIEIDLRHKIQNGTYPEKQLIPKEVELAQYYRVSRPTIRQAVQALVDQGFLEKRKRRGTMVKRAKIGQAFTHVISSYNQEIDATGMKPRTKVLVFKAEPATVEVAQQLALPVAAPVYKLVRLRYADQTPVVLVTTYIPQARFPNFTELDFSQTSLYATFAAHQQAVVRVRRKLEVLVADETSADLLDVEIGAPLFYFHTQGYTAAALPIEYSIAKYRGDLNYFRLEIEQKMN